jgi:uncharacterized protein (TIGR02001 family)
MVRTPVFAFLLLVAAPALAQDEPPPEAMPVDEAQPVGATRAFEVSGELNLLSDYRFRGVSRSDEDPAVQAGLMVSHQSGFYAGARGTSLQGMDGFRLRNPALADQGDVQLDLYAGFRRDVGDGFEVDGGLMYYVFAGGDGATDYVEPFAQLSYLIGPVYATAGAKWAPSQAATGNEDMFYLFGQVDVTVPFRPWSFSLQAGRQDWGRYGSYWTWSVGGRYHLQLEGAPNTEIGLRYVDTDLPGLPGQDAGVVLSVDIGF